MRALVKAARRVRRHLWLVIALAILHLAVAHLAAAPLSAALAPAIDDRPAATQLLSGDDALAGELLSDHPALVSVGLSSAQAAALLWGLFSWIVAGGVLAQFGGEVESETRGLGPFAGACGAHALRMINVGLCGLVLRLVPLGAGIGVWFALRPLSRGSGFGALTLNALGAAAILAILWSLLSVALDYARALALLHPTVRAWRIVLSGVRLAFRRLGATALIALFAGGGFLVTGALVRLAAHPLSSAHTSGFIALTVLRIALVLVRVAIALTALVACGLVARDAEQPRT